MGAEMSEVPDDFSEDMLVKHDLSDPDGSRVNPHELLIAVCAKCKTQEHDQRMELSARGWSLFGFNHACAADGNGFIVCPDCSQNEYSWNDLY